MVKKKTKPFGNAKLLGSAFLTLTLVMVVFAVNAATPTELPTKDNNRPNASFSSVEFDDGSIIKSANPKFAGMTEIKFNGKLNGAAGGYGTAKLKCGEKFNISGIRMCSAQDMARIYQGSLKDLPTSGSAWVNNGAPAHSMTTSNDCMGWTTDGSIPGFETTGIYGSTWDFNNQRLAITNCSTKLPIACCY